MIDITFKAENGMLSFEMTGHADWAKNPGTQLDLVCAWATGLGYTAAEAVRKAAAQGDLLRDPTFIIEKGRIKLSARPKAARYVELLHAFFVVQDGLRVLEGNTGGKYCIVRTFDQAMTPEQRAQLAEI